MADRNDRVPENVSGRFYVDSTCIDCDLCREAARGTSSGVMKDIAVSCSGSRGMRVRKRLAGGRWRNARWKLLGGMGEGWSGEDFRFLFFLEDEAVEAVKQFFAV